MGAWMLPLLIEDKLTITKFTVNETNIDQYVELDQTKEQVLNAYKVLVR
jgi:hypothetical protein